MKLLFVNLLVIGLGIASPLAHAAQDKAFYLARCAQQIGQHYGSEPDIKLVSVRRSGSGVRVKVAVRLEPAEAGVEKVQFTTCLLSNDANQAGADANGVTTPAPGSGAAAGRGR